MPSMSLRHRTDKTERAMARRFPGLGSVSALALLALTGTGIGTPARAETLTVGIGTQDTTTNTATVGVVIRQLKLLEKYLPKTGKYANKTIQLDWQNFTSGPPVTNGMMAGKLQFGAMGDYPLVVNGATFTVPATASSSTRSPTTSPSRT
jgi:NitT/TauT family transport system substrate-binding protein